MPADNGPCINPRNWHDPMPAVRALLVALDEWVVSGREPPDSRVPRIADGTLVPPEQVAFPADAGPDPARSGERRLRRWRTGPIRAAAKRVWRPLVPQVDADGNEIAGIRLPDIAVPLGTFTGWNLYRAPYPDGRIGGPRRHLPGVRVYRGRMRGSMIRDFPWRRDIQERRMRMRSAAAVTKLRNDRLLLAEEVSGLVSCSKP